MQGCVVSLILAFILSSPGQIFASDTGQVNRESHTVYESLLAQNDVPQDTVDADTAVDDSMDTRVAGKTPMSLDEVARELSNPVTHLKSLAIEFDYRSYKGSLPEADDGISSAILFKPSYPIQLKNGKNLILTATVPIVLEKPVWDIHFGHPIWEVDRSYAEFLIRQTPEITPSTGEFAYEHGHLGDIGFDIGYGGVSDTGFISMFGLATVWPASQDISAAREQFLLGPEVALGKSADWGVVGGKLTHFFDVAGENDFNTNETRLKLFFSYGLGNGWQVISNPVISYDWEAVSGEELSFPIGGGFAKTTRLGRTPLRMAFEIQKFIDDPGRLGPDWLFTFSLTPVWANSAMK